MRANQVIVAPGKSEIILFHGLFARMSVDAAVFSLDSGRRGISISHLPKVLGEHPFDSIRSIGREYGDCMDVRRGAIPGFAIFPVMDHDGDDRNVLPYVTGNLLRDVPLAEYVVPVLNYGCLEDVMGEIGYGVPDGDNSKSDFYHRFVRRFSDREEIVGFYGRLRDCEITNMEQVLYHVMSRVPGFQDAIEPPRRKEWGFLRR